MKEILAKVFHFYVLFLIMLLAMPVAFLMVISIAVGFTALATLGNILLFLISIFIATPLCAAMLFGLVSLLEKMVKKWFP